MIPKVQAVKRDLRDLTITVIYSDNTTETYMDGYSQLDEIKNGLTKGQVHQIVNLSKTTIKAAPKSIIHYNGDDDDLYRQIDLGDWMDKASGTATATDIAAQTAAATKAAAQARAQTAGQMAGGRAGKTSGGNVFVGAPFDPGAFDPLRARVGAAGAYMNSPWATVTMPDFSATTNSQAAQQVSGVKSFSNNLGSAQAHTSAPCDDPLAADLTTAQNMVACCDIPDFNGNANIYFQDRYPSIPVRSIIDDAIEILNKHKGLHISKISFCQSHLEFQLVIKGRSPHDKNFTKTLEVMINHRAFERFSHEVDRAAKLKAKWDTNTYIKMRIAYLLFRALRLNKHDAEAVNLDIFRILGISSHPIFTY